ncbi:nuclear transport factor 2 family protein [Microbacterium sp. NPDC077184]|uniref:ester cyclase n=1 Tax=Microbacterium sp. NPDC077184 TaxID=3154764 RepID=UPI00341A4831
MTTDPAPRVFADTAAAERNAAVVRRFFAEVLAPPHDLGRVNDLVATDFVDHTPDGRDPGRAGVAAKLRTLFTADPGATFFLESIVAAGDRVAAFSELRTTQTGGSSGGSARFADLYVVRDGRIAEHRHVVSPPA